MEKEMIVIVGAGIAGLVAARKLSSEYEVVVLESTNRIGGRCYGYQDTRFSNMLEGGAEFIHGESPETFNLLKEAGLETEKVEGKMMRKEGQELKEDNNMDDGWDGLMEKMRAPLADTTLSKFFSNEYAGEEHAALRQQVIAFAEGFDLADPAKVSIKSLYREWNSNDEQYRIKGGYSALIKWLLKKCVDSGVTVITEAVVEKISWMNHKVNIHVRNRNTFTASKCLITVPLGILSEKKISFEPELNEYGEAFNSIGFGQVIKFVFEFKEAFWPQDAGFIFSNETIPTWWTQLPDQSKLLTGWIGGPLAKEIASKPDEVLVEKAVYALASIFNKRPEKIREDVKASKVFNWINDPSFLGGYSYATPSTAEALEILNNPVNNTLYFAGEAYHTGEHPGTVEAAIENALQQAGKILSATPNKPVQEMD